jgi:hypothetical protein
MKHDGTATMIEVQPKKELAEVIVHAMISMLNSLSLSLALLTLDREFDAVTITFKDSDRLFFQRVHRPF